MSLEKYSKILIDDILEKISAIDASQFVKKIGDSMTGILRFTNPNAKEVWKIYNTTGSTNDYTGLYIDHDGAGARIVIRGNSSPKEKGYIILNAHDGTNSKNLSLSPTSSLLWDNKEVLTKGTRTIANVYTVNQHAVGGNATLPAGGTWKWFRNCQDFSWPQTGTTAGGGKVNGDVNHIWSLIAIQYS